MIIHDWHITRKDDRVEAKCGREKCDALTIVYGISDARKSDAAKVAQLIGFNLKTINEQNPCPYSRP